MTAIPPRLEVDDLTRPEVRALLAEHLADMHASSPPGSVHALDIDALAHRDLTVWTVWNGHELLGCGALRHIDNAHGEIKSMRTTTAARGQGVGTHILEYLIDEARRRGYARLSLETGVQSFFEPARRLYYRYGFTTCPPFGDYQPDPNSVFLTRTV